MTEISNLPFFKEVSREYAKQQEGADIKYAIIDDKGAFTYTDIVIDSTKVKRALSKINVSGKNVAIYIPNLYEYVPATLGIWLAGAAVVPLSLLHVEHELEYFMKHSECSCVVTTNELFPFMTKLIKKINLGIPCADIDEILATKCSNSEVCYTEIAIDSPALMIYTSGTTGKPKGVVLTHKNISAQMASLNEAWLFTNNDRLLHVLPLHHLHGILVALYTTLYSGATVEMMSKFSASKAYDRIMNGNQNLTLIMGVPAIYNILLLKYADFSDEDKKKVMNGFKQFRLTICGSAPLQESTFQKWHDATGHYMLERYGMSEIGMGISNSASDPATRIPGCIGNPLPGVSVRLLSDDGKEITDFETPGEVQIKGDNVFEMYYNNKEAYLKSFTDDGWFKTGDVGVKDHRNVFRLLGRNSTDIIKSGGYKLSSIEIERSILKNENVEDVSVVALPDSILGEIPGAAIVLKNKAPGSDVKTQIESFCVAEMARYKVPKKIVYVDDLPRNLMKKVDKKKVKDFF